MGLAFDDDLEEAVLLAPWAERSYHRRATGVRQVMFHGILMAKPEENGGLMEFYGIYSLVMTGQHSELERSTIHGKHHLNGHFQ